LNIQVADQQLKSSHTSPNQLALCLKKIGDWSFSGDTHCKETAAGGGIAAIVNAMKRALVNLAGSDENNRVLIATTGGIYAVIEAMGRYPQEAEVQHQGCRALANLAFNNDNNKVLIATTGGISVLLEAMRQHPQDSKVQYQGCRALVSLAVNDNNSVPIATATLCPRTTDIILMLTRKQRENL